MEKLRDPALLFWRILPTLFLKAKSSETMVVFYSLFIVNKAGSLSYHKV